MRRVRAIGVDSDGGAIRHVPLHTDINIKALHLEFVELDAAYCIK